MAKTTKESALALLVQVGQLAKKGQTKKDIAQALGFKTTLTLSNRLVKASQTTGKPIPPFRQDRVAENTHKRVETVEVRRRGKGSAFGVNIPQEPLGRVGAKPGDSLKIIAKKGRVNLTVYKGQPSQEAGRRQPRIIKKHSRMSRANTDPGA